MKWKAKTKPALGQRRYRKKFAWVPTVVENHKVWLETYGIEELYTQVLVYDNDSAYPEDKWVEVKKYLLCYMY